MKKYLKFILIVLLPCKLMAQWIPISLPSSENLNDLIFTTVDTGFIVGNNAEMLSTTNAGISWNKINNTLTHNLNTIHFPSKKVGYTNGLKTINGGQTWDSLPVVNDEYVNSIYFINDSIGFFAGANGNYGKTINRGLTWNIAVSPITQVFEKFVFTSDSIGYMVGWYGGNISKTVDQGNSWFLINSEHLYSIKFPSTDTGYAAGWYGKIIKTTDAGITWSTLNPNLSFGIIVYEIFCTDINTCYAVGDSGIIVKTIDGGNTWERQNSGTTQKLNSIFCLDNNTCFIVGDSGIILKTNNGGNVGISEPNKKTQIKIAPNPLKGSGTIAIENYLIKEGKTTFILFDLTGKQILTIPLNQNKTTFKTENLIPATYLYQVKNDNEVIDTGKLIIE
jgi:photosystem II stability/assembly factor-like uncharacterized protein